ncbi:ribonuclease III [Alkalibacter rhizosphaerae]|uniref:Ribonuclease 3 n=1 Tax=Alkalibacter rhizosphaerae TaxID=2815577 RepID=A0A974XF82_9FIRM|nr:ribonuclease III [Alkalibacter rhizosphaerae]QSX08728.1 ribonuclease III [Alkalibacter rhizosphaerae]
MQLDLSKLENSIGYSFRNEKLLENALTHSSYINEKSHLKNNERLEFLGDAVLELVTSDFLYRNYPDKTEGELTKVRAKIVCTDSLAKASAKHRFGSYMNMGKGEENTGGRERKSILANTFEAIVGAVYLDGGLSPARSMILQLLEETILHAAEGNLILDYKTKLQEIAQQKPESTLEYTIEKETGPEHNKIFHVHLYYNGVVIGVGKGSNKKEAEQEAAYHGLVDLGVLYEA